MTAQKQPIELAYNAFRYVNSEAYRINQRKKNRDPAQTSAQLIQAMDHLGPDTMTLAEAHRQAKIAIDDDDASAFAQQLDWHELREFLGTVALFLKATREVTVNGKKKQQTMHAFEDKRQHSLPAQGRVQFAQKVAQILKREKANRNKLKRLSSQIAGTRDKWEALAVLARYYPLRDVPPAAIDEMVAALNLVDLYSFKELVAQALVFFEASQKGWKGLDA